MDLLYRRLNRSRDGAESDGLSFVCGRNGMEAWGLLHQNVSMWFCFLSDWDPAIRLGVLDCGDEENYKACKEYGIQFYPTFRVSSFRRFTNTFL